MELNEELLAELKGRGFLLNRSRTTFSLRIVTGNGVVSAEKLKHIAEAAERFGNGCVSLTSRMGFEIMGIPLDKVEELSRYLAEHDIEIGGTGAKIRPIVCCKGTVCPHGLFDTQGFALRLHEKFYRGWHDVKLPAKFKIGVGGCPNNCVKPQLNDFAVVGGGRGERCLRIFIGGKYGKRQRTADELGGLYTLDEAEAMLERVLEYYLANAQPKERMGDLIDRVGLETVRGALLEGAQ